MVVTICTGRPDDLRKRWSNTVRQLAGTPLLVVFDQPATDETRRMAQQVKEFGGEAILLDMSVGLSGARNAALHAHPEDCLLFIDDDVLIDRATVTAAQQAFRGGAQVVGARLVPPPSLAGLRWPVTPGQMHLLGWHGPAQQVKVWGACMGIDAAFAYRHDLRFDTALGRTGRRLESGDDTFFVARMKANGAVERILDDAVTVVHDVNPQRLELRYLLRRAYWQGRSEVRRAQALSGLRKEWRRYRQGGDSPRAWLLTFVYSGAVLAGIARESLSPRRTAS